MLAWVGHCFRNGLTFTGRAARPQYWWFFLFWEIGYFVAEILLHSMRPVGTIVIVLWFLILIVPMVAVTSRRLHDTGHSLWWSFYPTLAVVPLGVASWIKPGFAKESALGLVFAYPLVVAAIVLFIYQLVLLCRPGDLGPNRYGDPAPTTPG
jgi:uncharacterized membrane protein YhaH (DUF805 family)